MPEDGSRPALSASVLLVHGASASLARLTADAAARGLEVVPVRSTAQALEVLDGGGAPRAAVVDLGVGGDPWGVVSELVERPHPVPTLVMGVGDDFAERLEAARRGVQGVLDRSASPSRVMDAVEELLATEQSEVIRVLAVDDDPVVHTILRGVVDGHGIDLRCVSDAAGFWSAVVDTHPDVVILDLHLPDVTGLDLCRVIRADARWSRLPVLVLTADNDPDTVRRVFEVGADDYVNKPIRPPELLARIRNRIGRIRLLRRPGDVDSLTGVSTRARAEELLRRYLRLGQRQALPLALAVLDVDEMKKINDSWGHPVGDQALRLVARTLQVAFRTEDVVARWGGEEFVVGLYGMSAAEGRDRLARILDTLKATPLTLSDGGEVGVTFSGGVAGFPEHGTTLQELYEAADATLYAAKEAGRERVLLRGESSAGSDPA